MRFAAYVLASTLLTGAAARAQLSLVMTPADQIGAPGEIAFTAALTNSGSSNLYLNDIQIDLLQAAFYTLRADTNAFYANVPGILLPGETYTDVVFGVTFGVAAPPGDYNGTVTILGGSNIFAESNLATASFEVSLPDSVGDGIPDWWRQEYFGGDGSTTNSQSCAACDADATGQNNLFKFVVGLNPTNSASIFTLNITNKPALYLVFGPVLAGRAFMPQFSDSLSNGVWQSFNVPIVTLTNSPRVFVSDPAPSTNSRFYRVEFYYP